MKINASTVLYAPCHDNIVPLKITCHVHIVKGYSNVGVLLPHAHAQGVKQSVCMSIVVVVRTKIASLGDLGP